MRRPTCFLVVALLVLPGSRLAAQGYAPEEAVRHMRAAAGLEVTLAACEPEIRQPVSIAFDDRGRMWVLQYLQYPTPAGLKPVKVDQYLRTVWDKMPEPPPRGPKGADCVTILAPDEHGRFHKVKDFVTGLNLASGMVLGHGGLYVVQPPYLLFYPDRNANDTPDSDPEVLLTGFGMQDPHAYANSLQWGPDGWLYGAQGSTVTANIRGITFQQGVWRYHPITKRFELFSEGGGNTYGLDFNGRGEVIAGTNGGNVVGLHQVQGAYYVKSFAKHGELQNPHAYGYFEHMPHKGFVGGHVTCGGIVYRGNGLPAQFRDTYIAANPLANAVYWHTFKRTGSTYATEQGGDFLVGNDLWFRPIDCITGPDGAVYIADWCDKRLNHVDPVDNWDRTNGRIYRVTAKGAPPPRLFDLRKMTSIELIEMLGHANSWHVGEARRLLAERRDPAAIPVLEKRLLAESGPLALDYLWALHVSGPWPAGLPEKLLTHPNEDVRAWTVRLLGDDRRVSPQIFAQFLERAHADTSVIVRCQLACTCKRLPGEQALTLLSALLHRDVDRADTYIPLLLWWALEDKAVSHREQVLALFDDRSFWKLPLVRDFLVERIGRRYLAQGEPADQISCARLITHAPGESEADKLATGFERALDGRSLPHVQPILAQAVHSLWQRQPDSEVRLNLAMRLGDTAAIARGIEELKDTKAPARRRVSLARLLGQIRPAQIVPILLPLLAASETESVRNAALEAIAAVPSAEVEDRVLKLYPTMPASLRNRTQGYMASRPNSARSFLEQVDAGKVAAKDVSADMVRRFAQHTDPAVQKLVVKHWGRVEPQTSSEKIARINSIRHMLGTGKGDAVRGKIHFQTLCANCHTLFGEGNKVGPELTGADRRDREFLILSIVDPSAVVRNEYVAQIAALNDGRLLTGLIVDSTPATVTLVDAKNERAVLQRSQIESLTASRQSLMPEKILDVLDEQQIRDLIAYLQSNPAPKANTK